MSYGFGIIGLGLIAEFHARAIEALPEADARLVACCSRSEDKVRSFAQAHDCEGYTSVARFVAHPGLDAVAICTPSGAHLEPALAAVEAGRHLIVEKPLEITTERCDRIIEAATARRVLLAGIFQSRFHEAAGVVKQAVEDGRFGRLCLGDAYVKWYRTQKYYDEGGWHGTQQLDGGGALINQSIHAIDLLQWFMGPVESVQAFTATVGHERIEVEDDAVAILRFSGGALGVVEGSTAAYPGFFKRIELSGTEGSVILEEETLKAWTFAEEQPEDRKIRERFAALRGSGGGAADPGAISFEGHRRQYEDFIQALDGGRAPLVDGTEARKSVAIIQGIYTAARKGRPVKLD
jgi:UDP-N-acetyl-2-amino-2-deoxyglucuronate dehydrogenase